MAFVYRNYYNLMYIFEAILFSLFSYQLFFASRRQIKTTQEIPGVVTGSNLKAPIFEKMDLLGQFCLN